MKGIGLGGEAVWAMPVSWMMTAVVFAFVLLRAYTRISCVAAFGVDDYIYLVAFVFLLIFTIFLQLAAEHGFGQFTRDIGDGDQITRAVLYECIGQGFAIVGMAIAKWSCGFFLLRLVPLKWQRISIWAAMAFVMAASIAQVFCFWLSCTPFAYVFDRRIPGGFCGIDTRPTSYILCVSTITVDVFFALLPWTFIWKLQMPRREKLTIAISMSLGLLAAAAGIKRTTEVEGLYGPEYLHDSVGLIVWSLAEIAVTMICIGVPVCRPLYRKIWVKHFGGSESRSNTGYLRHDAIGLNTIGGGRMPGATTRSDDDKSMADLKLGMKGPSNKARAEYAGSGNEEGLSIGNGSDEDILGEEYRGGSQNKNSRKGGGQGIHVTATYSVQRN